MREGTDGPHLNPADRQMLGTEGNDQSHSWCRGGPVFVADLNGEDSARRPDLSRAPTAPQPEPGDVGVIE